MRLTPDEADTLAEDILRSYRAGRITERAAREGLATLVCRAEIHRAVAFDHGTRHLSYAFREELASENLMLVSRLMLGGASNGYDLEAAGSLCGWARNLLYASRARRIRDLAVKEYNQVGELRADDGLEMAFENQADFYTHWTANLSAEPDEGAARATEAAVRAIRVRRRESERIEEGASMLAAKFCLTRPLRPLLVADREAVLTLITESPSAAYESVLTWLEIERGEGARISGHPQRVLLGMWSGQTLASAERLLELHHGSVHVLVQAACQRRPRPSQKSIASLRGRIARLAMIDQARWRRISGALVEAWVASEYEATSAHAPKKAAELAAQETGHRLYARRLDDLLERASRHPQAPLGAGGADVLTQLRAEAAVVFGR